MGYATTLSLYRFSVWSRKKRQGSSWKFSLSKFVTSTEEIKLKTAMNEACLLIRRRRNLWPITRSWNLCNKCCNNKGNTIPQLVLWLVQTLSLHSRAECSATIPYRVNIVSNMFKNRLHRHVSYFLRYYLERRIRSSSLSLLTGYHSRDIPSFVFTIDTSLGGAMK